MRASTMNKKLEILKQILLTSTGAYYEVNLTKNIFCGTKHREVQNVKYIVKELPDLKENAKYSDIAEQCAKMLPQNEREQYLELFGIENLLESFNRGLNHIFLKYWMGDNAENLVEQHVVMYTDDETDDVLAVIYVLDLTDDFKEAEYKKQLEETSQKLSDERQYLEVLFRNYILAYYVDISEDSAKILKLDTYANVWKMPEMRPGATFDYTHHIKKFAELFVIGGKDEFVRNLNLEVIKKKLQAIPRYSFRFESIPNLVNNRHFEVQVVRINPDEFDGRVVVVSQEIDDVIFTERQRQAELEAERKYLDVLTSDFVAVYHVNLLENKSMLIKVDKGVSGYDETKVVLRKANNYTQRLSLYGEKFVASESREEFIRSMEPSNILKELAKKSRFVYRYRTIQQDGKLKFFEVQAMRMNSETESGEAIVAFRDIDEVITTEQIYQAELEKRLEAEKNQNEVLEALGNSYYVIERIDLTDGSYTVIRCNDVAKKFYGGKKTAAEEFESICSYVQPTFYGKVCEFFNIDTLKQRMKDTDSVETEYITTDGNWHRARFIEKRRDQNGDVSHILYFGQIISDEKHREQSLISMAEYANNANAAKTEFISKVAHDIRTPMNSLFGFLQIAEANSDDIEKVKYCLSKIRVSGEFLKELVDDVLDISRMENGKMTLKPAEVSVEKIFCEFPTSMQGSNFDKKINFNYNIHDILCDRVIADSLRLKQIYTNILSNAVKYTQDGGTVNFEVYQEPVDDRYVCLAVVVADNGLGMSEEFMKRMFSKFERATDTRLNKEGGYGLGLTIVKQLVDMMNGKLDVQSEPGKGTRFSVKINLPKAEKKPKKKKTDYASMCRGMHLLVAEDNALSREFIAELLDMHGITCDTVADGIECVEKMFKNSATEEYDAILMDMQMPNMSGMDAARFIRTLGNQNAKKIPIIAMTANALNSDIESCLDAGMNMHLSKPVDISKLLKVLAKLEN